MAIKKFSLEAFPKAKGTLTSFPAVKVAQPSYQTSPKQMVQRSAAVSKVKKAVATGLSKAGANIMGSYPQNVAPKAGPSMYDTKTQPAQVIPLQRNMAVAGPDNGSQNFAGAGGNTALGQGTNVNNQPLSDTTISSFSGPLAEAPVIDPAPQGAEGGSAGAGASGGNVGAAGGYSPGYMSPEGSQPDGQDTVQPSRFQKGFDQASQDMREQQVSRDENDNFFLDGQPLSLQNGKLPNGINADFVGRGASVGLSQAQSGQSLSGGDARSIVQSYVPPPVDQLSMAFVQTDPYLGSLVQAWQEYIDPKNQKASLADTYKQMMKDSGIEELDMELINTKAIIEGSEEDIRNEITKAGGFATNSQVLGLTNARNKQLIKNYNTLLETRNAKEKYMTTMIGLEQADRQSTDKRFENMFNMGMQIADYQQKIQTNAQNQMKWLSENIGFDGLYKSTGGDPYYTSLVEKTLGLPKGGLLQASRRAEQERSYELEERALDLDVKRGQLALQRSNLATDELQRMKLGADIDSIYSEMTNGKPATPAQLQVAGYRDRLMESNQVIDQIGGKFTGISGKLQGLSGPFGIGTPNALKSPEYQQFEQAQRNFINANLRRESGASISPEEFKNARLQYFPQPGDSQEVLKQKAANRSTVVNSFIRESGNVPLVQTGGGSGGDNEVATGIRQRLSSGQQPGDIIHGLLQQNSPVRGLVLEFQRNQAKPSEILDYFLKANSTGKTSIPSTSGAIAGGPGMMIAPGSNESAAFRNSIIAQESGGRYDAIGIPTAHGKALGKYQVIPKFHFAKIGLNPSSSQDQQKFLRTPALQDKVFGLIIDGLAKQYKGDARKMAAAYYGGDGAVKKLGTKAADVRHQGGKAPSINEYVNKVVNRMRQMSKPQIQKNNVKSIA